MLRIIHHDVADLITQKYFLSIILLLYIVSSHLILLLGYKGVVLLFISIIRHSLFILATAIFRYFRILKYIWVLITKMHWWARFIGLRVTVRLLSKLVVFPLVFQFIIWIGLVLIVWMRLELLIILEWLNRWLNLLEWIFVLFKIVLPSKFIMVHWRSIIAVVIWLTCVLSEWRLRCWFKALLMGIEFKFFVQASLVKVTRLSVTSLWHWFYSWLESRTIWVHHVCFR